jgi:predicted transcriptional regulator with HTH domain
VSKHILDNLFGSRIRIKVLKFLFRNYPGDFTVGEIAKRIQESYGATKKEIDELQGIKLIKKH